MSISAFGKHLHVAELMQYPTLDARGWQYPNHTLPLTTNPDHLFKVEFPIIKICAYSWRDKMYRSFAPSPVSSSPLLALLSGLTVFDLFFSQLLNL